MGSAYARATALLRAKPAQKAQGIASHVIRARTAVERRCPAVPIVGKSKTDQRHTVAGFEVTAFPHSPKTGGCGAPVIFTWCDFSKTWSDFSKKECLYFQDIKFEVEYPHLDTNSIWFGIRWLRGRGKKCRLTS